MKAAKTRRQLRATQSATPLRGRGAGSTDSSSWTWDLVTPSHRARFARLSICGPLCCSCSHRSSIHTYVHLGRGSIIWFDPRFNADLAYRTGNLTPWTKCWGSELRLRMRGRSMPTTLKQRKYQGYVRALHASLHSPPLIFPAGTSRPCALVVVLYLPHDGQKSVLCQPYHSSHQAPTSCFQNERPKIHHLVLRTAPLA